MSTIHRFHAAPFTADRIDPVNAVIRGVSVITKCVARGHELTVDDVTIQQMLKCGRDRGQIVVKIDHKGGAATICGFLTDFRIEGNKLKADWFLLESHPQTAQILEVAARMPRGVGLSASFVSPDNAEFGKARCDELISVDYVTMPAANPDGLLSRPDAERPLTGVEKVRRALGAAGRGAEVGAVGGLAARAFLRRRGVLRITGDGAAMTGAAVGAAAAGAYQWRRDTRKGASRDLAARVTAIMLQDRAALHRVIEATQNNVNVPVPGADGVATAAHLAKKPLVRRIGKRLLKVGAGAGLGYLAGRKIGAKAGAVTGAVAGLLLESKEIRATVRLANNYARKITNL